MKIYGYTVDHGKPHEKIFISKWFHTKLVHTPYNSRWRWPTLIHEIDTEPSGNSHSQFSGFYSIFLARRKTKKSLLFEIYLIIKL